MSNPPLIASRYRVLRELGRGGMGVVYVVEHTRTGDQLALKLLHGRAARDPHSIERFKREARASARIKSEHVVKVVDADVAPELENAPFLVMELLNGIDLEKTIETRGRLPPDEAFHYLSQAARALDKSHAMGIVHRDLKPENLFVHRREDGSVILKILDYGISKIVGGDSGGDMTGAGMTSTGAVMGTPLYMAPEQARGRVNEIGPATDVWAMGLITLRLLTGELYWQANTVAELMSQILSEPMYAPTQRWPWLPPTIDGWFAASCARDPRQRFPGVGQQIDALGGVLGLRAGISQSDPSTPWSLPQAPVPGPMPPMPSSGGTPMMGAATTAATANERLATQSRPTKAPFVFAGVGVLVLAAAGAALLVVRSRPNPAVHDATPLVVAAPATTSATTAPAATTTTPTTNAALPPTSAPAAAAAGNPSPPGTASPASEGGTSTTAGAGRAAPAPWHPGPAAHPAAAPAPHPASAPYNPAAP